MKDEEGHPIKGEALVIRRVLSAQVKKDVVEKQHGNVFHICCHVNNKICSLIIDGEGCTNVSSALLVDKLQLPTLKHPKPYKVQWLNDWGSESAKASACVIFNWEVL